MKYHLTELHGTDLKNSSSQAGRHDREGDNLISIRRQIAEFILQDFSDNAVILVNGWVLSITEALLFALIARQFPPEFDLRRRPPRFRRNSRHPIIGALIAG